MYVSLISSVSLHLCYKIIAKRSIASSVKPLLYRYYTGNIQVICTGNIQVICMLYTGHMYR